MALFVCEYPTIPKNNIIESNNIFLTDLHFYEFTSIHSLILRSLDCRRSAPASSEGAARYNQSLLAAQAAFMFQSFLHSSELDAAVLKHKSLSISAEALFLFVGKTGFEPATPWSQTKCATGLRYFPFLLQFAL